LRFWRFFSPILRRTPRSTPFPYTTLFRSTAAKSMTDGHDSASGIVAATIARGEAFIRKGKYRRAIRLWRSLLESELDEIEPAREIGRAHVASGYYQLAQIALPRRCRHTFRRAT